jgi:hypothetical protein
MTEKQKIEIGEFLMDLVKDIDEDMIRSFRESVMK